MFEFEGHMYEFRYTLKSIEQIEAVTKSSIIDLAQSAPPITTMKHMLVFALYNEEGNRIGNKRGMEVAEGLIRQYGLLKCFEESVTQIMEDCPFLFQNA